MTDAPDTEPEPVAEIVQTGDPVLRERAHEIDPGTIGSPQFQELMVGFFEGCLRVAGFVASVERYREVEVSGVDQRGRPQTMRARGWPARILFFWQAHRRGTRAPGRALTAC